MTTDGETEISSQMIRSVNQKYIRVFVTLFFETLLGLLGVHILLAYGLAVLTAVLSH